MADKMAMKMGQRYLKKKLAGKQGKQDKQADQTQADNYSFLHYTLKDDHGKSKTKEKDVAYYTAQGVPAKDAKILLTVMHRANKLDSGIHFLWFKMGWSSVIGLAVPVAGDFVDAGLSYLLVYRKVKQVSDGEYKKGMQSQVAGNMLLGLAIGFTPYVGEIVDTVLRFNTRSAKALEKMLLRRAAEARKSAADAEKADVGMETAAPVAARNHAAANTSYQAKPVRRTPAGQKSQPARNMPTRDDKQYGDIHKRIAAKSANEPGNKSQKAKSGGSWFGKRGAQTGHIQNGRTGGGGAEVAPVPPPRPAASERGDGWF
ncbi:hypothetical protein JMJ35_009677 [Cladonia borealis]|uniref:PH domain-containing protein n=1 Tax=Cladonia borealis TaxID=184061 RepID=A0AA39QU57_9LECA|nr:hypothetical protein JMJ35_009677 [Cladonia borealis]